MRTTGKVNIHLNKLSGITTDAAAAMVGKKDGLTGLIMEEVYQLKARASEFTLCYCIIHQQSVCPETAKCESCSEHSCVRSTLMRTRSLVTDSFSKRRPTSQWYNQWPSRAEVWKRICGVGKGVSYLWV